MKVHRKNIFFSDDNLGSADPSVQEKAVLAVPSFVGEYFKNATEDKRNQVGSLYKNVLTRNSEQSLLSTDG